VAHVMSFKQMRPVHGPVTLLLFRSRSVLSRNALVWVFENEAAALFAAAEFSDEPWFVLRGAFPDQEAALQALRSGDLLVSHSARAPVPVPRTGPFLRKCGVPGHARRTMPKRAV